MKQDTADIKLAQQQPFDDLIQSGGFAVNIGLRGWESCHPESSHEHSRMGQ